MEILKTNRLSFSEIKSDDLNFFLELHSNKEVRLYLGGAISREEGFLKFKSYLSAKLPAYHIIIRTLAGGRSIGLVTLEEHHEVLNIEISYQFISEFWGKGYAYEAVKAVLEFSREKLHLPRVVAETQKKNLNSIRLLEKLEMKLIREVERYGENQLIFQT